MTAPNIPSQSSYDPSNLTDVDSWLIGDGQFVWVLKVTPVLLSTSTPTTLYFSTDTYRDQASPPRLVLPSISLSILNSGFGQNAPSTKTIRGGFPVYAPGAYVDYDQFKSGQIVVGSFSIENQDGQYDDLVNDYGWGDADVELQFGQVGGTVDTFFVCKIRDEPTFDEDRITFSVKSAVLNPNGQIQTEDLSGTTPGSGDYLDGKSKPILIGKVDNLKPIETVHATLRYLIDDDGVDAISEVYEGGYPVGSGGYTATLASGYFELANPPVADITCDATGDARQGAGDYSLGANFKTLADDFGGSTTPVVAGLSEEGGFYIPAGQQARFADYLDLAIKPLGIYWPAQDGSRLLAGELGAPEDGSSVHTFTDKHISSITRVATSPPVWRVRVGYRPLSQTLGSFVGAVDEEEKVRLSEPQRFEVQSDATILTDYPNALAISVESTLYTKADATSAATLLLATLKIKRDIYRVKVVRHPMVAWIGEIVTLDLDRYGLSGGKKVMVTGWTADLNTKSFELEAWG